MRRRVAAPLFVVLVVALLPGSDARSEEGADAPKPLPAPRIVGPRTGPERTKALARFGGNAATEAAVTAGLDWLARHQGESGAWDADGFDARCDPGAKAKPDPACSGRGKGQHGEDIPCPFDAAITACATLAFLGAGHLPGAAGDPHGPVVERALESLRGGGDVWGLALATECFAEAEALERKGRWRADVDRGVERLIAMRGEDGAWGYAAGFRPGSDVPYSAFVVSALVAARDAGATLPDGLGKDVDAWLSSLEEKGGKLAYLKDGRQYGYTPTTSNAHCAFAMRELLEVATSGARHRSHVALVAGELPVWKISFRDVDVPGRGKVPVQIGNLSMYQWWFGTIGAFQRGGETWTSWFGATRTALLGSQKKSLCARGSWDPEGTYERQTGGRVFATALGVLMLEHPYRHRRLAETAKSAPPTTPK